MRTAIAILFLFLLPLAPRAAAQTGTHGYVVGSKVDVSGGYEWLSYNPDSPSHLPLGWYVDVAGHPARWLGIVWQASGSRDRWTTGPQELTDTIYTLMGGVRVSGPSVWRVTPFSQALTGAVRFGESVHYARSPQFDDSDSVVALGLQVGGGTDIRVTNVFGIRAGVDYTTMDFGAAGGRANGFRFVTGVRLRTNH